MNERSYGVLLPIFSLPSPYGVGTLGKEAFAFVDFLHDAGARWWQVLPLGPTGYGDSPYQSVSSAAGNPYFIDWDLLIEDGLLKRVEVAACDWGGNPQYVDYGKQYENRFRLLQLACDRGWARDAEKIAAFRREHAAWLDDYALYMALKRHFAMQPWTAWEEPIRMRKPEALAAYRVQLAGDIRLFTYIQFLFYTQWDALRAYAHEQGIRLLGDLPIYVPLDSADVWASPENFLLDEKNLPKAVAGVPPDYFSEDGQLWGNPLYDWDAMRHDGFGWWIRRIDAAAKCYDAIRIDHFRAFASYWAVPADAKSAKRGKWMTGPGMSLIGVLTGWFPQLRFLAEDLGVLTDDVRTLLQDSKLPGMKVLQFAFDDTEKSDYLPHNHVQNCACYTGTHDNEPLAAWAAGASKKEAAFACEYLGCKRREELPEAMLRAGMQSTAGLFIAQMQDFLGLGAESRVNTPGVASGNWQWRMTKGAATKTLAKTMARMAKIYGRAAETEEE